MFISIFCSGQFESKQLQDIFADADSKMSAENIDRKSVTRSVSKTA